MSAANCAVHNAQATATAVLPVRLSNFRLAKLGLESRYEGPTLVRHMPRHTSDRGGCRPSASAGDQSPLITSHASFRELRTAGVARSLTRLKEVGLTRPISTRVG